MHEALQPVPWTGIGGDLEAMPLWPTKWLCLLVLLCSALSNADKNLMSTQNNTSYFLLAQYAELACGGIKQIPDSVILSKMKLQRLGNRTIFPIGCDQYDSHLRNTGLTTPFQVRFKLGCCTLWYVF